MPSSVIDWMRYDPGRRALWIAFRARRQVYQYVGVPPEEWEAFRSAASKGAYLNQVFKERSYPFRAVDGAYRRRSQTGADERLVWPGDDGGSG